MLPWTERDRLVLSSFVDVMHDFLTEHHTEQIDATDLTTTQAHALAVLRTTGDLCTGELAKRLGISAPAVTQLTNRLLKKELIERRAATDDRRSVILGLNGRGRQVADLFQKRRGALFCKTLAKLDDKRRARLVRAIADILEAFSAEGWTARNASKSSYTIVRKRNSATGENSRR